MHSAALPHQSLAFSTRLQVAATHPPVALSQRKPQNHSRISEWLGSWAEVSCGGSRLLTKWREAGCTGRGWLATGSHLGDTAGSHTLLVLRPTFSSLDPFHCLGDMAGVSRPLERLPAVRWEQCRGQGTFPGERDGAQVDIVADISNNRS